MKASFHAEGGEDYRKVIGARRGQLRDRQKRRFFALIGRFCRRKGLLGELRIALAWRRVGEKYGRLRPEEDTSRALWLGA